MKKREILSGIYQYSFRGKDRKYIGSSINLSKRNDQHISCLRNNYHSISSFQNDFNNLGINNLEYCIIEIVDNYEFLSKEINRREFQQRLFKIEQSYLNEYYAQEYLNDPKDLRFFKLLYNKSVLAGYTKSIISINKEKEIYRFSLDGEFIDSFYNSEIAGICCRIDSASIKKVCYNQRKSAGGFIWSYNRSCITPYSNKVLKRINQYDLDRNLIATYNSIKEAYRVTGIDIRKTSKSLTQGGFYWLFDNEDFPKRKRMLYNMSLLDECRNYLNQTHKYRDRLNFCKEMATKYNIKITTIQSLLRK